jgi:hypothetical protein
MPKLSTTTQKALALGVLLCGGVAAIALLRDGRAGEALSNTPSGRDDGAHEGTSSPNAKDPRQVLSRPWFDHYPKSRNEEIDLWWFSSAGIGVHERGSVWRSAIDFFDFERQSSKLEVTFLHDKKKQSVSFEVVACEDKPPFDLCLDVKEPLRGKKRFYSFAYDDEMDSHVPWARAWRSSAEARSRAVR